MKLSNIFYTSFAVYTAVAAGPAQFKATDDINTHFNQYFGSVVSGIKLVGAKIDADTKKIFNIPDSPVKRDDSAPQAQPDAQAQSSDLPESVKTAIERFFKDNIHDLYLIAHDFKLDFEEFLKPFIHD